MNRIIVRTAQKILTTFVLIAATNTLAFAAKTAEELKKDGYSCEAISGGMECRKGEKDVKYLCDAAGKTCENYRVGKNIKSNADSAIGIKPTVKSLDAN